MGIDSILAAVGDRYCQGNDLFRQQIELPWSHNRLELVPGHLQVIGMVRQRTPDIRHSLNAFGCFDVVKNGLDLASRLRLVDKLYERHNVLPYQAELRWGNEPGVDSYTLPPPVDPYQGTEPGTENELLILSVLLEDHSRGPPLLEQRRLEVQSFTYCADKGNIIAMPSAVGSDLATQWPSQEV